MGSSPDQHSFWSSPWGYGFVISLLVLVVGSLLVWTVGHMFNWWRTRIMCDKRATVNIVLIRSKVGRIEPQPILRVNLRDVHIFTRQPDGYYWLTARVVLPDEKRLSLDTERFKYEYSMDLNWIQSLEITMPDWSLWQNNGKSLLNATVSANLHINDRRCRLAVSQKPSSVDLWDQE
jgi:hypothetical protein